MAHRYRFTVFTATYNRPEKLARTFASIQSQSFRDFEWLIVDDGSGIGTQKMVESFQAVADFPIRYLYQENTHKPMAFNRGVCEAKGELFVNIDDDDTMKPNALERFEFYWSELARRGEYESVCSVTALCEDHEQILVGTRFPDDWLLSDSLTLRALHKVKGEKFGCQRVAALREFPFPGDLVGFYQPESLVWLPMSKRYKTLYVNEVLRVFYLDEESVGTTSRPWKNAAGLQRNHVMILNDHLDHLTRNPGLYFRSAAAMARYGFHLKMGAGAQFGQLKPLVSKILMLLGMPVGYVLYRRDIAYDRVHERGSQLLPEHLESASDLVTAGKPHLD